MQNYLILSGNPEERSYMENYMKNKFTFLGLPKPDRAKQTKELLKESQTLKSSALFGLVSYYYHQKEREYHYLAIDLVQKNYKRLTKDEITAYIPFISTHSWWDSVDAWRKVFEEWVFAHPEYLKEFAHLFLVSDDFWQRRVGINLQLHAKEKTNTKLLEKAILFDIDTDEFFIQKAIGWSLREYSKTNPKWVTEFIESHPNLSKLAVREGSKYLK